MLNFELFEFLDKEISSIIENIAQEFPNKKPIIRLKVEYKGD